MPWSAKESQAELSFQHSDEIMKIMLTTEFF